MSVRDATNKILSLDSNYIVYMVVWPKFGNSSILWEKLLLFQFYEDLTRKADKGWAWFKFSKL